MILRGVSSILFFSILAFADLGDIAIKDHAGLPGDQSAQSDGDPAVDSSGIIPDTLSKDVYLDANDYFLDGYIKSQREKDITGVKLKQLRGFQYCPQLNSAAFDMNVFLDSKKIVNILNYAEIDFPNELSEYQSKRKSDIYKMKQFFRRLGLTLRTFKSHFKKARPQTVDYPLIKVQQLATLYPLLIDTIAEAIFTRDISRNRARTIFHPLRPRTIDLAGAKTFSCYVAAEGYNDWVKIGDQRIMHYVDGQRYFSGQIDFEPLNMDLAQFELQNSNLVPNIEVEEKKVSRKTALSLLQSAPHKLAYFLLVHDGFENIVKLLDRLYDEWVVIGIHVDGKNLKLKFKLMEHLKISNYDPSRVFVIDTSVSGAWGHASLVFAQMQGMFEMLKFNKDWEYLINLSAYDYPLVSNTQIYNALQTNGEANWIDNYEGRPDEMRKRMNSQPMFKTETRDGRYQTGKAHFINMKHPRTLLNSSSAHRKVHQILKSGKPNNRKLKIFRESWTQRKHSQWMMLHRSFIEIIQKSPIAATFLANSEFGFVPDEFYYATLALNLVTGNPVTGEFTETKLINKNARYLEFKGISPRPLTMADFDILEKQVKDNGAMFARKIDISKESELIQKLDNEAKNRWK